MARKLLYPDELKAGIRVQYYDSNEAQRDGRIAARQGNILTVVAALKSKKRVGIEKVIGYWKERVKASPKNLIRLKVE